MAVCVRQRVAFPAPGLPTLTRMASSTARSFFAPWRCCSSEDERWRGKSRGAAPELLQTQQLFLSAPRQTRQPTRNKLAVVFRRKEVANQFCIICWGRRGYVKNLLKARVQDLSSHCQTANLPKFQHCRLPTLPTQAATNTLQGFPTCCSRLPSCTSPPAGLDCTNLARLQHCSSVCQNTARRTAQARLPNCRHGKVAKTLALPKLQHCKPGCKTGLAQLPKPNTAKLQPTLQGAGPASTLSSKIFNTAFQHCLQRLALQGCPAAPMCLWQWQGFFSVCQSHCKTWGGVAKLSQRFSSLS